MPSYLSKKKERKKENFFRSGSQSLRTRFHPKLSREGSQSIILDQTGTFILRHGKEVSEIETSSKGSPRHPGITSRREVKEDRRQNIRNNWTYPPFGA